MDGYERYAIYWAPDPGALADMAAAWLGWDPAAGCAVPHPDVARPAAGLWPRSPRTPRKYGFHGTVKPPFRLAGRQQRRGPAQAAAHALRGLAPVALSGPCPAPDRRFRGADARGRRPARSPLWRPRVVEGLDRFRAPPDAAEIARRRPERLSARQRDHLARWGYPYVMEEFQFHLTLTGRSARGRGARQVEAVLAPTLRPAAAAPLRDRQPVPVRAERRTGCSACCTATRFPAEARPERPATASSSAPLFSTTRTPIP